VAGRNYTRLEVVPFGEHLLRTGDLDPVYIALTKMDFEQAHLHRWLIAYWCLYHCGAASWLSELKGREFWMGLLVAADNRIPTPSGQRWPRASERRHWRGKAAIDCVNALWKRFPNPEDMVSYIVGTGGSYEEVSARAKEMPLFGPWISFKICDMADRVLGIPVDFDEAAVFMFKDPVKAAAMVWQTKQRRHQSVTKILSVKPQVIKAVVTYLTEELKEFKAPPLNDRPVNLQEIETVLCKWKSHMNGHYPLNNDIIEIREGVKPWMPHSETAGYFMGAMPLVQNAKV